MIFIMSGCVISLCRLRDFLCVERLCDFFVLRCCMIFFFLCGEVA